MDVALTRRQTSFAAAAQMIVVSADDDEFIFQNRIEAVDDADNVGSFDFATEYTRLKTDHRQIKRSSRPICVARYAKRRGVNHRVSYSRDDTWNLFAPTAQNALRCLLGNHRHRQTRIPAASVVPEPRQRLVF